MPKSRITENMAPVYKLIATPFITSEAYPNIAVEIFRKTVVLTVDKHAAFFNAIHGQFISLFAEKRYSEYIDKWEKILACLRDIDGKLFNKLHKGTPFYFCGVASFEAQDYQRAIFYFDAALIEDKEKSTDWKKLPAALFLTLNTRNKNQFALGLTHHTCDLMKHNLRKYRTESKDNYSLSELRKHFLVQSIKEGYEWRSAITALFSFILEKESRIKEFSLRSSYGGTMEPFFLHLFKGGLLLETILKLSPNWKGKSETAMLGNILKDATIMPKLGITDRSADVRKIIFNDVVNKNAQWRHKGILPADRFIWTAYGIRNTTGHKLSWSTSMTLANYRNLADDILFAILHVISKLY